MPRPSHSHRPPPGRLRVYTLRALSLLLVLAVGFGVYVLVDTSARQDCVNRAYARSLDERGRAIDELLDSIVEANRALATEDEDRKIAVREDLDRRLANVKATRDAAKRQAEIEAAGGRV